MWKVKRLEQKPLSAAPSLIHSFAYSVSNSSSTRHLRVVCQSSNKLKQRCLLAEIDTLGVVVALEACDGLLSLT